MLAFDGLALRSLQPYRLDAGSVARLSLFTLQAFFHRITLQDASQPPEQYSSWMPVKEHRVC